MIGGAAAFLSVGARRRDPALGYEPRGLSPPRRRAHPNGPRPDSRSARTRRSSRGCPEALRPPASRRRAARRPPRGTTATAPRGPAPARHRLRGTQPRPDWRRSGTTHRARRSRSTKAACATRPTSPTPQPPTSDIATRAGSVAPQKRRRSDSGETPSRKARIAPSSCAATGLRCTPDPSRSVTALGGPGKTDLTGNRAHFRRQIGRSAAMSELTRRMRTDDRPYPPLEAATTPLASALPGPCPRAASSRQGRGAS